MQFDMTNKFTLAITLSCVLSGLTHVAVANIGPSNPKGLEGASTKTENSLLNKELKLTVSKSSQDSYADKEKRVIHVLLARISAVAGVDDNK